MTVSKIFAVDILTGDLLKKAKDLMADTIVCNEDVTGLKDTSLKVVNAEIYRIPGTWESYAYDASVARRLSDKIHKRLVVNGISFSKAITKLLYWTNYKVGYLHACIKEQFPGQLEIVYMQPYLPGRRLRETIKYFYHLTRNNYKWLLGRRYVPSAPANSSKDKVGILVNDEFELGVFEYLVKALPPAKLSIFYYGNIDFNKYSFISGSVEKINIGRIRKNSPQYLVNPFRLDIEELSAMNIVARDWQSISTEMEQYKYISQTGIKSLVINVGENQPIKNLMRDVFKGRIRVYNTMNGIKSGEAHDSDVNFTKWFVWDEQMKKLLVDKCSIDPETLSVSGHLMQDFVGEYAFGNTLDMDAGRLNGKKVISVFSVRGRREEKVETFKYLYDLLSKDSSYFLLVRAHPSESSEDLILPEVDNGNIHFVKYNWQNSKQTLYDQLHLSDIGIVFGSTVAIECRWMGVPAITFEKREISNVYCTDNTTIKHIRSLTELKNAIESLDMKGNHKEYTHDQSVANRIMNEIL